MERKRCTLSLGDKVKFEFTIYEQEYFRNEAAGDIRKCRQNTGRKIPPGTVGTVVSVHEQEWALREYQDGKGNLCVETVPVQWLVSVDFGNDFIEALRAESAIRVRRQRGTASQLSY